MNLKAADQYYEGYKAYRAGAAFGENPYPHLSYHGEIWDKGWIQASNDVRFKQSKLEQDIKSCAPDNTAQQFESLAQPPIWNGEGLPPVGCECEAKMPVRDLAEWSWRRVKVVVSGMINAKNECLVYDLENTYPAWVDEFRPIRTEAEQMRIDVISEMMHVGLSLPAGIPFTREEMTALYDAIAAGKVPHIKVEV